MTGFVKILELQISFLAPEFYILFAYVHKYTYIELKKMVVIFKIVHANNRYISVIFN